MPLNMKNLEKWSKNQNGSIKAKYILFIFQIFDL